MWYASWRPSVWRRISLKHWCSHLSTFVSLCVISCLKIKPCPLVRPSNLVACRVKRLLRGVNSLHPLHGRVYFGDVSHGPASWHSNAEPKQVACLFLIILDKYFGAKTQFVTWQYGTENFHWRRLNSTFIFFFNFRYTRLQSHRFIWIIAWSVCKRVRVVCLL